MNTGAARLRAQATDEMLVGPIRGELLGLEHLAARARAVARSQRLASGTIPLRPARLLARLADTRGILAEAYGRLLTISIDIADAGPAAEWLLDNYHVVQEHLLEVRSSLPGGFYRELPELSHGPLAGYPRVYEIAISLISHTEARIDLDNVNPYVEAFQSVTPLSIGELWAMPAMLRLGLIESVRRMALRTIQRLDETELADHWAERVVAASARGGAQLRAGLREFADAEHALTPHFVSRFLQSLRRAEGASPALAWLEHWLRDAGVSPEESAAHSTQRLALTQIMMANSIMSLREVGRCDWRMFVEQQSAMEAVLRTDPSGFYSQMTFATRDRYRHVVERIAKRTGRREVAVAQWVIARAQQEMRVPESSASPHRCHVGYYLIDDGALETEQAMGYIPHIGERVGRAVRGSPNMVFLGGLLLCTGIALLALALLLESHPERSLWLVLLFTLLPALDVAANTLNQLVTTVLAPDLLPRLDLHEHGVPAEYRTAVVMPTLFGTVDDVQEALANLEVQFLANRETHLHFAVLSDFLDAPAENMPGDEDLVAAAVAGVRALNERHSAHEPDAFHLLHRPRRWNAREGVWMGWERKRGKLAEFNSLLRGGSTMAFSTISGDIGPLQSVKYVITLDSDTVLPPDAAPALVGALAHPLNRAVYDPSVRRIVRGYGILQPRVGVSLPSAHHSRFASIASGYPGVDPYSTAVSDVYQDLYGEGSYTGKGIYDVDAFQLATHGRFPENALLSHDLIEGNYARAGLATDVIVYDDYPSSYVASTQRKHRWIRGDWQLLPWLRRHVPGPDGPERNRLSLLSQWKILDNLRRSTVEISQLMLLVAGWTLLPGSAVRWTLLGFGAIVAPWVTSLLLAVIRPPLDKSWRAYYAAVGQDAIVSAKQFGAALTFLPHQAWISADAIGRTLYRLAVSRKHLLEWRSASLVEKRVSAVGAQSWRAMRWTVAAVVLLATGISAFAVRHQLSLHAPLSELVPSAIALWATTLLWVAAPSIADWLSKPAPAPRQLLSESARAQARRYAAVHWKFFERFVSEETHWLAPDNFQATPDPIVAMRTSPTNIGLQLLATTSAHDLGLIPLAEMVERLERAFATMQQLQTFRGHFFNWYDLHDLRVLEPRYISTVDSGNIAGHLIALRQACLRFADAEPTLAPRLHALADQSYRIVSEMDFVFLYNAEAKLFTIGYQPDTFAPDASCYDLLASEARLASFVAIAKNDVPVEHWFRLSRALNVAAGSTALVSWSGSMFEYLMPVLVMRSLPYTLLDQTYQSAVRRHRAYARGKNVPWGVSECAYNVRDRHQTYQYRAFGIPDLALKRGLGRDLVIAPYATALATMIDPTRGLDNLRTLESMGALDEYGFCDALDYTRPVPGDRLALVRTYMAHHIGMTLVSLTNVVLDDVWQERFHSDALVKSAELLLFERVPRRLTMQRAQGARPEDSISEAQREHPKVREIDPLQSPTPRVALLGSTSYAVMVNHTGSGYSRYGALAVTRWRADSTADNTGQFCYLRDRTTGKVWSSAQQPVRATPDWMRVQLTTDRVLWHRVDGDIETRTELTVVPADGAEVRRITLTNTGSESHDIELTSYGEVVLTSPDADRAHPAFSNLFVETEWHAWCTAVTATRRPRTPEEPRLWCVHVVDAGRDRVGATSCETDRGRFLGRGHDVRDPQALRTDGDLSGFTGAVLDPIVSLRTCVRVTPGQTVSVAFTTLVAASRESAFELAGRYHDSHAAQRAFEIAWTSTQIELAELGVSATNAAVFQDLAGQVLFGNGSLAPPRDERSRNRGAQPRLWSYGISGDLPIVLAVIDSLDGLQTLRDLFAAHRFWRRRGLAVDLVIVNTHSYDYLQELRDAIVESMIAADDATHVDLPGGVHIRRREAFTADDYLMLSATARVEIACDGRTVGRVLAAADSAQLAQRDVGDHIALRRVRGLPIPALPGERSALASLVSVLRPLVLPLIPRSGRLRAHDSPTALSVDESTLRFGNGIGGVDGSNDYVMTIDATRLPPAPWANVIANPHGGFLVSERGAGCMWAENAYFYRVTPWHNDPVSDPCTDVLYLRDDESDVLWSATPAPVPTAGQYRVRHGAGRSTFEHVHDGIVSKLEMAMPSDAAVKVSLLTLTNTTDRPRQITVTAYAEWALGARREDTQHQVYTRYADDSQAVIAQNHFDERFTAWASFLATSEPVVSYSCDRLSFIGRDGHLGDPRALGLDALDGRSGVGLDPCGALQWRVLLAPGEHREMSILLGAARTEADAQRLIARLKPVASAQATVEHSAAEWNARLSVISVATPDPAFDTMLNKWTLYQALSSRMWARMGLYQSGGAYGFRDQLQDVLAFVYAEPGLARAHLLRAAARQFPEGDVQHWWHAHSGRGVRTRFSDDLAWLPYVVDQYVRVTGDAAVLDEYVPFLNMRVLKPGEHELYDLPTVSDEHASVYEHCLRALRRACTVGTHGLPLIGSGDWNDGMSLVGAGGTGESVWLAWFLVTTLRGFAVYADARHDAPESAQLRALADAYVVAIEANAWDGQWYRRAFYDDGTPIGSASSDECRIDSIAQSWSVISGAGLPARQSLAMQSLQSELVRDDAGIIMLLTPPFDRGTHDPGYIKGYLPGVRENGAQYTHAALWAVMATAMQGNGDRAFELFQMINPLTHTDSADGVARYRVEPYVVAADVYTAAGQLGRGGWTWYTGSASWMYRVGLEQLLGFTKVGSTLRVAPCVPDAWPRYDIAYRFGASTYEISVIDPAAVRRSGGRVTIDGVLRSDDVIPLVDDGERHVVSIEPATRT